MLCLCRCVFLRYVPIIPFYLYTETMFYNTVHENYQKSLDKIIIIPTFFNRMFNNINFFTRHYTIFVAFLRFIIRSVGSGFPSCFYISVGIKIFQLFPITFPRLSESNRNGRTALSEHSARQQPCTIFGQFHGCSPVWIKLCNNYDIRPGSVVYEVVQLLIPTKV